MATLKSIKNKYLTASDGTVLGVTTNTENVAALSFKLATADSLTKFNMVDGFTDDYNDATGVDAATSTDETRDATGNYYWGSTGSPSVVASGGTITTVGDYTFHYFTASGDYVTNTTQALDIALVGGGGSGGRHSGGGGGGGGLIYQTGRSVAAGTYAYVHGTGGVTRTTDGTGNNGVDSTWNGLTAKGGGGGGYHSTTGNSGGSGGGSSRGLGAGGAQTQTGQAGDSGTYGFGNAGGSGNVGTNPWPAAGGGGAGAAGGNTSGANSGPGGAGKDLSAIFGSFGVSGFFAGGGGGQTQDTDTHGTGGSGGGGDGGAGTPSPTDQGAGRDGVDYTGGGGGGSSSNSTFGTYTASGGDGTLIIRRPNGATNLVPDDMTLQSNVFAAQTQPTTARIILDEESYAGATTLNTDIKAYASRDNGTTFTQVTLADQGQINYLAGIDQYTKLMLHCDGSNDGTTFTDSSATGHTMTASGNTHTDTAIKKFGTASAQFDGTGDYITSAASTEFSFTGDFTIDCWCYFSAINTTIAYSQANADWNSATTNDWILLVDGGGNVTFNVKNVGAISSAGHGALSVWKHIAIERASGTSKLYVDGALTATGTGPGSGTISTNNIVALGRASTNLTGGYNGYIDEFRISKGIARYGAAFTPPATPYEHSRRLLSGSVDISGQPAGTSVKYKIETLNQAAAKQTRVYGTSMAWA